MRTPTRTGLSVEPEPPPDPLERDRPGSARCRSPGSAAARRRRTRSPARAFPPRAPGRAGRGSPGTRRGSCPSRSARPGARSRPPRSPARPGSARGSARRERLRRTSLEPGPRATPSRPRPDVDRVHPSDDGTSWSHRLRESRSSVKRARDWPARRILRMIARRSRNGNPFRIAEFSPP